MHSDRNRNKLVERFDDLQERPPTKIQVASSLQRLLPLQVYGMRNRRHCENDQNSELAELSV